MMFDPNLTAPTITRFWSRVDKTADCWLWTGGIWSREGYGRIVVGSGVIAVHRLSYFLHSGAFDTELCVCHHCDTRLCVKSEHLFLGTRADNNHDREMKGRGADHRGELHGRSKLKTDDVLNIRSLYASGKPPKEIAAQFAITEGYVHELTNRRWRHI